MLATKYILVFKTLRCSLALDNKISLYLGASSSPAATFMRLISEPLSKRRRQGDSFVAARQLPTQAAARTVHSPLTTDGPITSHESFQTCRWSVHCSEAVAARDLGEETSGHCQFSLCICILLCNPAERSKRRAKLWVNITFSPQSASYSYWTPSSCEQTLPLILSHSHPPRSVSLSATWLTPPIIWAHQVLHLPIIQLSLLSLFSSIPIFYPLPLTSFLLQTPTLHIPAANVPQFHPLFFHTSHTVYL